jgi:1,4-alpha-glucan branching enzyme
MNVVEEKRSDTTETITFRCQAAQAAEVFLIGDFNHWDATAHPMHSQSDGSWFLQVPLPGGRHYYQFLVDGEPMLDPQAMYFTLKDRQERVSFIGLG